MSEGKSVGMRSSIWECISRMATSKMNNDFVKSAVLFVCIAAGIRPVSGLAEDTAPSKRTADSVLVVYNSTSPVSTSVANDYAEKRNVTRMLSIQCVDSAVSTDNESIS